MINPEKDISNLDFPVAGIVWHFLSSLSVERKQELLNTHKYISARVDIDLPVHRWLKYGA